MPARTPIVLIVVDTLRADHLGSYGYARDTTPNLDVWSRSGRVFEHAVAPSSWTLPSTASLLTGWRPSEHRAGIVPLVDGRKPAYVSDPSLFHPMSGEAPTLAEAMRDSGRRTGAIVTNSFLASTFGVARGFEMWAHEEGRLEQSRRAGQAVDLALEWIGGQGDAPYFLMLHLFDPHLGYDAPAPHHGRFTRPYEGGRYRLPFLGGEGLRAGSAALQDRDRAFVTAAYDEEIRYVDQELERLRAGLAAAGRLDETLVVLTSDHGEELFDHGRFEHGHALWQEVLRVPLVFWGPGVAPGREAQWVSLLDVPPTLLEAIGMASHAALPGRSLWPNITRAAPLEPRPIESDGTLYGDRQRMLIDWPYKLIAIEESHRALLFDLEQDPGEQRDLAAQRPDRVKQMRTALAARIQSEGDSRPGELALSPEALESLRSLGYID